MNQSIPICIMEPTSTVKRDLVALKLFNARHNVLSRVETISIDDIKSRLKGIREYTCNNTISLSKKLKTTLEVVYPNIKVKIAKDNIDALTYISEISDEINILSINNSSIVNQELRQGLINNRFTVINSYIHEFNIKEKKSSDYSELSIPFDSDLMNTFDITKKIDYLPNLEAKKYLAVLGVNAMSAEDGTIFFLEHLSNIDKDLRSAEKLVFVVGLDKIVGTTQEAAFQTRCMGIFGMESVVLNIRHRSNETRAINELPLTPSSKERELHLIILDNGRSRILESKFRDLLLCIGCRACAKHCPVSRLFTNDDYTWTPRNYLLKFLYGSVISVDLCLHCESCHIECPLDIDLPYLMWEVKLDSVTRDGVSFHYKLLGRPEILARVGTMIAPVANWLIGIRLIRVLIEIITGIDRRANLPRFRTQTFRKWFKKHGR